PTILPQPSPTNLQTVFPGSGRTSSIAFGCPQETEIREAKYAGPRLSEPQCVPIIASARTSPGASFPSNVLRLGEPRFASKSRESSGQLFLEPQVLFVGAKVDD